ncbi:MAG: sulfotransferase [Actinomycetota bacterium]|nr:sulfotransferase [Actinomycetota bacterium]
MASRRDPERLRAPIFVVGCWRSGTTFLARALGQHPRIAHFPNETGVLRGFFRWLEDGVQASTDRKAEVGRRFVSGWLDAYRRTTGKPRVLEKTPPNVHVMNWVLACFPDAQFIHIVRDPRAVVSSMQEAREARLGRATVEQGARFWNTLVGEALRKGGRMPPGRYLQVRYEALLARPTAEFGRILEFLGEPAEPLLAFVERETDRSRAERWRDLLPDPDVAVVEQMCAELMRELGYEPSRPAAVASAEGERDA